MINKIFKHGFILFFAIATLCSNAVLFGQSIDGTNEDVVFFERAVLESNIDEALSITNPYEPGAYQLYNDACEVRLVYTKEAMTDFSGLVWDYSVDIFLEVELAQGPPIEEQFTLSLSNTNSSSIHLSTINQFWVGEAEAINVYVEDINSADFNLVPIDIRLELHLKHENRITSNELTVLDRIEVTKVEGKYQKVIEEDQVAGFSYLPLTWPLISGADFYELAYVFIDAQDLKNYSSEEIFEQAIIVETDKNFYDLDLSYPEGALYIAVRSVGINSNEGNIDSYSYLPWDFSPTNTLVYEISFDGVNKPHENELHYGFQSSFAEEGKFKKVISYYDQSLRNQQTVTYLNDEDVALVAESDYDREGRPSISVLPAPNNKEATNLFYQNDFNRNLEGDAAYSWENHEQEVAQSLSPLSGAGKYFSENNNSESIHRDFIPQSSLGKAEIEEAFPFVQTKYLRDNTGRISAQGGVGEEYQIGSGHETVYYYSNPSQTELARLFGSDIGDADHFKKTFTKDPNGQVSVTYLDMKGNVVATALVGDAPDNVLELEESGNPTSYVHSLATSHIESDGIMSFNSFVKVTAEDVEETMDLYYEVTQLFKSINLNASVNDGVNAQVFDEDFCFTCSYDLEIKIVDPTGQIQTLDYTVPDDFSSVDFESLGEGDCDEDFTDVVLTPVKYSYDYELPGTYTIQKILTPKSFDQEDIYQYLNDHTLPFEITNHIEAYAETFIDLESCYVTCEQRCEFEFGTGSTNYNAALLENCIVECTAEGPLQLADCVEVCGKINYYLSTIDVADGGTNGIMMGDVVEICDPGDCQLNADTPADDPGIGNCDEFCLRLVEEVMNQNITYDLCMEEYCNYQGLMDVKCGAILNTISTQLKGIFRPSELAIVLTNYTGTGTPAISDFRWWECWSEEFPLGMFDANGVHYKYYNDGSNYVLINVSTGAEIDITGSGGFSIDLPPINRGPNEELLTLSFTDQPSQIDDLWKLFDRAPAGELNYWQGQFINSMLPCHRDFCQYENCMVNAGSDNYSMRMLMLKNMRSAYNIYNIASSSYEATDFKSLFYAIVAEDPYYENSCTDPTFAEAINELTYDFIDLQEPDFCTTVGAGSNCDLFDFLEFIADELVYQDLGDYEVDIDEQLWAIFSGIYQNFKQTIYQDYVSTVGNQITCELSLCPYSDDNFTLFQRVEIADLNNYQQALNAPSEAEDDFNEDLCEGRGEYLVDLVEETFGFTGVDWNGLGQGSRRNLKTDFVNYCAVQCEPAAGSSFDFFESQVPFELSNGNLGDNCLANGLSQDYSVGIFDMIGGLSNTYSSGPIMLQDAVEFNQGFVNYLQASMETDCRINLTHENVLMTVVSPNLINTQEGFSKFIVHNNTCGQGRRLHLGVTAFYYNCDEGMKQIACSSDLNPFGELMVSWKNDEYDPSDNGRLFIQVFTKTPLAGDNLIAFEYFQEDNFPVSDFAIFKSDQQGEIYNQFHNKELKALHGRIKETYNIVTHESLQCDPIGRVDSPEEDLDEIIAEAWDCEIACGQVNGCVQEVLDKVKEFINEGDLPTTFGFTVVDAVPSGCYDRIILKQQYSNRHSTHWEIEVVNFVINGSKETVTFRFFTEDGLTPNLVYDGAAEGFQYDFNIIGQAFTNFDYSMIDNTEYEDFMYLPIKFLYKTTIQEYTGQGGGGDGIGGGVSIGNGGQNGIFGCEVFFQTGYFAIETKSMAEEIDYFEPCVESMDIDLILDACLLDQNNYFLSLVNQITDDYLMEHMGAILEIDCLDGVEEIFTRENTDDEYHYTLYYYDQLGNIVKTIPPEGVERLDEGSFDDNGELEDGEEPDHTKETIYYYNNFNQIVASNTHDAGLTTFYYDDLQRLRFSQNEEQLTQDGGQAEYSYTNYDPLSRIIEVGEVVVDQGPAFVEWQLPIRSEELETDDSNFPLVSTGYPLTDRVKTYYSEDFEFQDFDHGISRNRVTATKRINGVGEDLASNVVDDNISYYSYDIHGNVKKIRQEVGDYLEPVDIEYDYDLISGNVKELAFNRDREDQFFHRYSYDADNRLLQSFFSRDRSYWEEQARYFYYLHGPLARVEYGDNKVQGLDYIYTMQGWIKGGNLVDFNNENYSGEEPGKDGVALESQNRYIGRDASSFVLTYNDVDYRPIGSQLQLRALNHVSRDMTSAGANDLGILEQGFFNGNIAAMSTQYNNDAININSPTNINISPGSYAYQYDQLHRIRNGQYFHLSQNNNQTWINQNDRYEVAYNYDKDGNLRSLTRNGFNDVMDELSYRYPGAIDSQERTNQLIRVDDESPDNTASQFNGSSNYVYDAIGNITSEFSNGDETEIAWDVYNKIRTVTKEGEDVEYFYDSSGNRVIENGEEGVEIYIRDAQGNCLAIYHYDSKGDLLTQREVHLYGSSRLGSVNGGIEIDGDSDLVSEVDYSIRQYELSNHLGNVLATFTGRKLGVADVDDSSVNHYEPEIVSASDYYPFGQTMDSRTYRNDLLSSRYRFGFNGKEKDESGEFGSLTHYDYGFRIYNPSIGRFLSVDPLTKSYPMLTPYQFASNRPIDGIDLDGLEYYFFMNVNVDETGNCAWELIDYRDVITMNTGIGDFNLKIPTEGHFGFYNDEWRLVPTEYIDYSFNKISDEEWLSFTTLSQINNTIAAAERLGKKAEMAVAFGSLIDGAYNLYKGYKGYKGLSKGGDAVGGVSDVVNIKKTKLNNSGSEFGGEIDFSNGETVEILSEFKLKDGVMEMTDIAFYPKGVDGNQLKNAFGGEAMKQTMKALFQYAKDNGASSLRIHFERAAKSSSAKPGKIFDRTFEL